MENDPQRLAQIKGITQEKAQEIGEELRRAYGIRELMMFLGTYGVRPEETVLVWKQYGEASVACIQEDPYCLCGEASTSALTLPTPSPKAWRSPGTTWAASRRASSTCCATI